MSTCTGLKVCGAYAYAPCLINGIPEFESRIS